MSTFSLARVYTLAIRGAAATALALPLTLVAASPAHALTSNGCTVTPLTPVQVRDARGRPVLVRGVPVVRFPTRVQCVAHRIVRIVDQRYERDDPPAGVAGDQSYGSTTYLRTFATGATVVVSTNALVRNTEAGPEEAYHRVSIRVASIDRITNTGFQNSGVLSVNI